jgi:O-antigen ligase
MKKVLKQISFLKASRFFFYAFILFLPFQINVIIYTTNIFSNGMFNPFTSVFIYLGDFFFLVSFILWGISIFQNEYKEKISYGNPLLFVLLILFLILIEISVLFAKEKLIAFSILLRFIQLGLLYFFVINKTVKLHVVINIFIGIMAFQAIIAILQYITQSSVGLYILGESHIAPEILGVAKINVNGATLIRPYGTFPHPNILAAYLLVAIFLDYYGVKQKEYIAYPLLVLLFAGFVLAFSRGAFLAFLIGALVYVSLKENKISFKYILFGISVLIFFVVLFNLENVLFTRLLFTDTQSLYERVFYYNISKKILFTLPFGIGAGNFTLLMQNFTNTKLDPWDFQPVHNIYMLLANEIGIIGCVIFLLLFLSFCILIFLKMKQIKDFGAILISIISAIFVLGLFDHYLISLYHGQTLLFLIFSICGFYVISHKKKSIFS